jgi:pentatricopeptide repeat protein
MEEGETAALSTALVHMYVKCGAVEKAREMLGGLRVRNVFMWSSLIAGYAQQGQAEVAFDCFREMQSEGLSPNAIVFGCVLNACSHSGLVNEGEMYFTHMRVKYGIEPDLEHYTCMVDLFGRAGHLDKAMVIIEKMPLHDYRPAWSALLNACHQWGNAKLGKLAFKHAVQIDSGHIASYVCMSNISTAASIKDGSEMIG